MKSRRRFGTCNRCGATHGRNHLYCAPCHAAYMREWRKTHPLTGEALKRAKARWRANLALRRGELTRQPCEVCGGIKVQMHHDDYDKPLDVRWFCHDHHLDLHGKRPAKVPPAVEVAAPS